MGLLVVWLLAFLFVHSLVLKKEEDNWGGKDIEKVNGVFVYLVSKEKRVEEAKGNSHPVWDYAGDAIVSLRYLHQNFNSRLLFFFLFFLLSIFLLLGVFLLVSSLSFQIPIPHCYFS